MPAGAAAKHLGTAGAEFIFDHVFIACPHDDKEIEVFLHTGFFNGKDRLSSPLADKS